MTWIRLIWSPSLQKLDSAQSIMYSLCGVPSTGMRTCRMGLGSSASTSSSRRWWRVLVASVVEAQTCKEW